MNVLEPNIVAVLVVAYHQGYIFIICGIIGAQNSLSDRSNYDDFVQRDQNLTIFLQFLVVGY
ncbi:hypothetical protein E2986_03293 [Frieseomelitta varia]|uniref:Uncharacterized protein n=1 Tax=Frieseomelitta varia TaxID=561572 RepID=A0A833W2P5_9HYME|nr:hypothetical protein E2986_03293 [Frieseomelitta varia]